MCGIVGYIGDKDAYPILVNGLKRLEYRGYDSAGIALRTNQTQVFKCKGKVQDLENHVKGSDISGSIGIDIHVGQLMGSQTMKMRIHIDQ